MGLTLSFSESTGYVVAKLWTLKKKDIAQMRQAFIRNHNTRFFKSFSYHLRFGVKEAYAQKIESTSLNKIAGLIEICGFLMQTKAYLFWERR